MIPVQGLVNNNNDMNKYNNSYKHLNIIISTSAGVMSPRPVDMAAAGAASYFPFKQTTTYIIYKDMMEQSTETTNNEIAKRKKGRPKGTGIYTGEEAKERARQRSILYYSLNFEKERERTRLEYHAKKECCLKLYYFLNFIFLIFHLNN